MRQLNKEVTNYYNNNINGEIETKQEDIPLKAFFVSVATSQEEAKEISEGRLSSMNFMPLYAESQEAAMAFLSDKVKEGLIVISFEPLEALEMKVFMLRNIAQKNDIILKRDKMYDGRLLLVDQEPPKIYSKPTIEEDISDTDNTVL